MPLYCQIGVGGMDNIVYYGRGHFLKTHLRKCLDETTK